MASFAVFTILHPFFAGYPQHIGDNFNTTVIIVPTG
jgi:hypothetical protein